MTTHRETPAGARVLALVAAVAASTAWAHAGHAASSTQVFVPASQPHRIALASNDGMFISEDDGASWRYVAELDVTQGIDNVLSYELATDGTLFAAVSLGIFRSTNLGCNWSPPFWPPGLYVRDLFADLVDPQRVFAIASDDVQSNATLYVSRDRGAHFTQTLFTEPRGKLLRVESARSRPSTVYLTGTHAPDDGGSPVTFIAQSLDDGMTFSKHEHPELLPAELAILQVDPDDADRVYVRITAQGHDTLAVATDAGAVVTPLLALPEGLAGFARTTDGTLWVAELDAGTLWSSETDGGFRSRPAPLLTCLGSRGDTLFACSKPVRDAGFDLGRSDDRGDTFTLLLKMYDPATVYSAACNPFAQMDAGTDAGAPDAGQPEPIPGPHCGCDGASTPSLAALLALLALVRRARARTRLLEISAEATKTSRRAPVGKERV